MIHRHLTCLLWNLYADQEATVRTDLEQWTGSKLGKEYIKAIYYHPAYLTYMPSTSREMSGWMNHKLDLEKAEEPEIKLPTFVWILEKPREFQKNIYFCFNDYAKAFNCVDHNKLWKILKEMGLPDYFTYLLRNLYVGQEATAD